MWSTNSKNIIIIININVEWLKTFQKMITTITKNNRRIYEKKTGRFSMKKNWYTRIRGNKKAWIFFLLNRRKTIIFWMAPVFLQIISIVCLFVCTHVYLTNKLTWIKTKQQHGYYKFRISLKNLNGMAKGYDIEEASRFFVNKKQQQHCLTWPIKTTSCFGQRKEKNILQL